MRVEVARYRKPDGFPTRYWAVKPGSKENLVIAIALLQELVAELHERVNFAGSGAVKTRKLPATLTFRLQRLFLIKVTTKTLSFRKIQDAHRKDRAEDARALKSGKISPAELQETNSFIPADASIRIADLAAYVRNRETN